MSKDQYLSTKTTLY